MSSCCGKLSFLNNILFLSRSVSIQQNAQYPGVSLRGSLHICSSGSGWQFLTVVQVTSVFDGNGCRPDPPAM